MKVWVLFNKDGDHLGVFAQDHTEQAKEFASEDCGLALRWDANDEGTLWLSNNDFYMLELTEIQ